MIEKFEIILIEASNFISNYSNLIVLKNNVFNKKDCLNIKFIKVSRNKLDFL